ncbi:DUF2085 domain-containing protein [Candidatus Dojkabacteria bacterium]|uniref:DUF2085 domain-containing protein n=1 Tax=Candidatus Dojkabacteria bacterium TaxID=2099670 RepID=A0A955L057_9BACT|nr:DUF2085 domain-containing protein [Candidatus Dojkabacteria bacterium]
MKRKLKFYDYYMVFLGVLVALPILAPVLLKLAEAAPILHLPANIIYLIYSFTCHQFSSRSLHLFDYQYAWCARDTGIWLGVFLAAVFVKKYKAIKWYWMLPFIVPIALDGGIQTVATVLGVNPTGIVGEPFYISSNLMRFLTGSLFGIGLSMWISPFLLSEGNASSSQLSASSPQLFVTGLQRLLSQLAEAVRAPILLWGMCFIFFLGAVQLWNLTSTTNRPSDFLDSAVKTPLNDFYTRREDGPCPAGIDDLVRINCFFGGE